MVELDACNVMYDVGGLEIKWSLCIQDCVLVKAIVTAEK